MATLRLVLAHDPARLLEHAADGFLAPPRATLANPFPSPRYLLALRQGGLREDLLRLAESRGVRGWFDPPLCVFAELTRFLGQSDRAPLDSFERSVLISGLLRERGGVFARARQADHYADAVGRLFGELISEGVVPDRFAAALEGRAGRDDFERARDADIAATYGAYLGALAAHDARDGRDALLDSAATIRADAAALSARLGGRREIRLFGLHDLRGGWRTLLEALVASPALDAVTIYTSRPLDLGASLSAAEEWLAEPECAAARLFSGAAPGEGCPTVDVIAAPDTERELEEVARRIRVAASEGVPLPRIAVVARQARPYADLAVAALERVGVPATARRRVAYREVPVVRGVLALFAAAAEGWERHGLAEIAEQPYVGVGLDPLVINHLGFRRRIAGLAAWERALAELETAAVESERRIAAGEHDEDRRWIRLPSSARVRETRDAFARFAAQARPLDTTRSLGAWIDVLVELVERDPWGMKERVQQVPDGQVALARIDLAGWRAMQQVLGEWRSAIERWGGSDERIGVADFSQRLRDMLDGDVALWTGSAQGVQVVEGLAGAYRAFDRVFVVGLEAGKFPTRQPSSPVLDDAEREALIAAGLPLDPRETWDERERELFRALVAGASRLTLSYPRLDVAGREVIRSAFVEAVAEVATLDVEEISAARVVTPGLALCPSVEVAEHAERVARIERSRRAGVVSPHSGLIEDESLVLWLGEEFGDERLWSPTQLESYAKCPWSYFASRLLRVEQMEDPSEEMDHAVRGTVLHRTLERTFASLSKERGGAPVFLRGDDRERAKHVARRELDGVLAEQGAVSWLGHPVLQAAKREELRRMLDRYMEFEVELNEKMFNKRTNAAYILRTSVTDHELSFRDAVLERGGVRFRFRGSIDRVEVGTDDRLDPAEAARFVAAVDYKTTKYSVPGAGEKGAWDDDVVLQVPLYAHALAQHRRGAVVSRVEYRAIKHCTTAHSLELYQVDRRTGKVERNDEAHEKMERALDAVAAHVLAARGGLFPVRPASSCGCPPFCVSRDLCRVPGGPREVERA